MEVPEVKKNRCIRTTNILLFCHGLNYDLHLLITTDKRTARRYSYYRIALDWFIYESYGFVWAHNTVETHAALPEGITGICIFIE